MSMTYSAGPKKPLPSAARAVSGTRASCSTREVFVFPKGSGGAFLLLMPPLAPREAPHGGCLCLFAPPAGSQGAQDVSDLARQHAQALEDEDEDEDDGPPM